MHVNVPECSDNIAILTLFGRNRGRKRIPRDAPINLDKFSASDANSEPNLA